MTGQIEFHTCEHISKLDYFEQSILDNVRLEDGKFLILCNLCTQRLGYTFTRNFIADILGQVISDNKGQHLELFIRFVKDWFRTKNVVNIDMEIK